MNVRIFVAAISFAVSTVGFASAASAGGFLGDVIDQVLPGVGTTLNDMNRQLGRPTERFAGAVMDAYVPGSGQVAQQIWRNNANGGGRFGMPQQAMGNFCYTQAGRFGPGPVNPVGSFCTANTPWGTISGQVGQ